MVINRAAGRDGYAFQLQIVRHIHGTHNTRADIGMLYTYH